MSRRQAAVKRYVVTLSAAERERLEALIRTGKHSARKLLRARILLKADASEAGEALTRASRMQQTQGLELAAQCFAGGLRYWLQPDAE
jgi:hypothetical protein